MIFSYDRITKSCVESRDSIGQKQNGCNGLFLVSSFHSICSYIGVVVDTMRWQSLCFLYLSYALLVHMRASEMAVTCCRCANLLHIHVYQCIQMYPIDIGTHTLVTCSVHNATMELRATLRTNKWKKKTETILMRVRCVRRVSVHTCILRYFPTFLVFFYYFRIRLCVDILPVAWVNCGMHFLYRIVFSHRIYNVCECAVCTKYVSRLSL